DAQREPRSAAAGKPGGAHDGGNDWRAPALPGGVRPLRSHGSPTVLSAWRTANFTAPNEEIGASEGNPRHEFVGWQATQRLSGRIAAVGPDLAKPADSGGSMGFSAVTLLAAGLFNDL